MALVVLVFLYEKIIGENLSVRDTERVVKEYQEPKTNTKTKPTTTSKNPNFVESSLNDFKSYLSVKVEAKATANGKGKLVIPFHSKEEFDRIKKLILGE